MKAHALFTVTTLLWASISVADPIYLYPPSPPYCGPKFDEPDCIPWGIYRALIEIQASPALKTKEAHLERIEHRSIKISEYATRNVKLEWWNLDGNRSVSIVVDSSHRTSRDQFKAIFDKLAPEISAAKIANASMYWCTADSTPEDLCTSCEFEYSTSGRWRALCVEEYVEE